MHGGDKAAALSPSGHHYKTRPAFRQHDRQEGISELGVVMEDRGLA
jgi:hypothetical protein